MKRWLKWTLISLAGAIAAHILAVVITVILITHPRVHPIPEAYHKAEQLWFYDGTPETKSKHIELIFGDLTATIAVTHVPTVGTEIEYSAENKTREIFPTELYFGATEVRYAAQSGRIYVMVEGMNAVFAPSGKRIFEFDVLKRNPLRDYWVEVN